MNHEELMKKLDTVICNLNDDGLALMYYFIGDMHAISSLTGKERKFWDKIEKVCKMDISRYTMKTWQTMLLAKIYNNNYLDASYKTFCFGFHQGLKYAENRMKTQKLV